MGISNWMASARWKRRVSATVIVLAAGGMILVRSQAFAKGPWTSGVPSVAASAGSFSGPLGAGSFGLSHASVLAGEDQRVFAQLKLRASETDVPKNRAPLSMVVVLDTSGSMEGEKIEQAKNSVVRLIRTMRDDDQIALVTYSSDSQLVQGLATVGSVRESLIKRVERIEAGGGTNIAPALAQGLSALVEASGKRVRRVVLVSDGLDSSRAASEALARKSTEKGVTISTMGIGLDFDEAYMGAVARAGRGNFAFVKDSTALASFLQRELKEGSSTMLERARAVLRLPEGVRFVRALGADATLSPDGRELALSIGSLFAGDERRVVVELVARVAGESTSAVNADLTWHAVNGQDAHLALTPVLLRGTRDAALVDRSMDNGIFASAASAMASMRQLEAVEAYNRGDDKGAQALIDANLADLRAAAPRAPAPMAAAMERQAAEYSDSKAQFSAANSGSAEGKAAAKARAAKDQSNLDRSTY